jgi:hypothetical protein
VKWEIPVASWCIAGVLLFSHASIFAAVDGRLKVTENRRYLQYENGKPFFYLGDTAWELFHRLNREEATQYLTNRSQKGFTVIQAVVLAQLGGLTVPNPYGDLPLIDGDPARPNEAYFRHVDFIVNKAEELGMFIGMLPTWGSYWAWGKPAFTTTNARQYGRFLGNRYKSKAIIWILGGDRSITNDEERAIIDAMAAGLGEGDGGTHLKTFHPIGPGLSSIKLHNAAWLDFNMFQSSHASRDHDNGLYVERDYALKPEKPTMDGEPRYEGIPVGFYLRSSSGIDRFDDYDARQAAYWSLLAGACGHTYGNNNIWQMFKPGTAGRDDAARGRDLFGGPGSIIGANIPWYEALDHPGAFQMRYVRRLFESLPFTKLIPDQRIILNGPTTGGAKIRAARASDGSFALIYSPRGESFTLDKSIIKAERLKETWYDPRYGTSYVIKEQDTWGIQTYTPPTSGRGNDWVLVLTDVAAGYTAPGTTQ